MTFIMKCHASNHRENVTMPESKDDQRKIARGQTKCTRCGKERRVWKPYRDAFKNESADRITPMIYE